MQKEIGLLTSKFKIIISFICIFLVSILSSCNAYSFSNMERYFKEEFSKYCNSLGDKEIRVNSLDEYNYENRFSHDVFIINYYDYDLNEDINEVFIFDNNSFSERFNFSHLENLKYTAPFTYENFIKTVENGNHKSFTEDEFNSLLDL